MSDDLDIESDVLAHTSLALARRFAGGATLWCAAPRHPSHARHVAVEFVHPVVVGARALPAVAVEGPDHVATLRANVRRGDVILVVGTLEDDVVVELIRRAPSWGAATVLLTWAPAAATAADHVISTRIDGDAALDGTAAMHYHLLWELTHICFEHPGLLQEAGAGAGSACDRPARSGAMTDFLYPFLDASERDADVLLADLAASARAKAGESTSLRSRVVAEYRGELSVAAAAVARRVAEGGRLFTFGNGGSSTDAAAYATLFAGPARGRPVASTCLVADPAVITALGNDVGFDLVFARQLLAHGGPADIAVAFSTSGDSANVVAALRSARAAGLLTIGFAGYDGGAMTSAGLDHLFVVRAHSVHRIQEAQAALAFAVWQSVQEALVAGQAAGA